MPLFLCLEEGEVKEFDRLNLVETVFEKNLELVIETVQVVE